MSVLPSPTRTWHSATYPAIDPTRPELSAKDKNVVVTGGGTGIGTETAKQFAKAGVRIFALPTDATKRSEVDAALGQFAGEQKIHVLVSNAGVLGSIGPIKKIDPDEWLEGIVHNLRLSFIMIQSFLRYASSDAVVIDVSSAAVHRSVVAGSSSYSVAKAGARRLFDALSYEHPEICMYNIQPGIVETAMSNSFIPRDEASLPATFMVWLASPEARFLRGKFLWANWDVDELKSRAEEIEASTLLNIDLVGWPFKQADDE